MTLCVIHHINCHFDWLILSVPFSLHGFPAPFRRRFPALPYGVMAGYPMQTVFRFSRYGAGFGNKKSPHNNLNLTILSGMALVRVRYVAIRKLKTCFDSFGSRAGTLSKYVILNCWNRLPQKSQCVNKKLWRCADFGSLQEKARETLAKRERNRGHQISWQGNNSQSVSFSPSNHLHPGFVPVCRMPLQSERSRAIMPL